MGDAAGFTNSKYNASRVEVVASPAAGATVGQEATAYAAAASASSLGGGGAGESIPSIMFVVVLSLIRAYFILVVMAYARQVVRGYAFAGSAGKLHLHTDGTSDTVTGENPFAVDMPAGDGWRGKLGRVMVKVGEGYWLGGRTADDAWVKGLDGRFKTSKPHSGPPGTVERERRARSGTGPPVPPPNLKV